MTDWMQLVGGGVLLYFGAEWFVGGASALALALRIPQILIGLTVVAYGTSAPEVVVGIEAASAGHGDLALANVIGSNIANVGLILGVAVLIKPARVHQGLRGRELPVLMGCLAFLPLLLIDGKISRWEVAGLLLTALGYTIWMVREARSASSLASVEAAVSAAGAAADAAGAPEAKKGGSARGALLASVGLLLLVVGGSLFVDGSVAVARTLGLSDQLVGLTIVAVGTSLPELATSIVAALRGHSDLAVGNVVGSNIFNVLVCLGAAALAGPVGAPLASVGLDLVALTVMTILLGIVIRAPRTISRVEGGSLLALYVAFMVAVVTRG